MGDLASGNAPKAPPGTRQEAVLGARRANIGPSWGHKRAGTGTSFLAVPVPPNLGAKMRPF